MIAGMGALPMPYGRFLLASTIGAIVWSTYTCLMAYFIGTALADFPIASVALACASSAILLGSDGRSGDAFAAWIHRSKSQRRER